MSPFSRRIARVSVLLLSLGALVPGAASASPPTGFSAPQQVTDLTSCIGASATAADGTDVVFSEDGPQNDVRIHALVRRPGTTAWHGVPTLHIPAYSTWDVELVAIGSSDVLLSIAWYDASGHPSFTLYRLHTGSLSWGSAIHAFPTLDQGNYEDAAIGVTAAGGLVAATTYQTYDSGYHYAVKVAYRAPGATSWHRATYSNAGSWQFIRTLSVAKNGYAAVSFIQEDSSSSTQTGVGVVSRSPGSTHWRRQLVDTSGSVVRSSLAVGADGEALLAFSDAGHDISVARTVMAHGDALPTWTTLPVTSSTAYTSDDVFTAVDGKGHGTVLINDHTPPLYAHLDGATVSAPVPLDNGARRDIQGISMRPDGIAVATAVDYTSGGSPTFTGADAIAFGAGGGATVETLETIGNPWSNGRYSFKLDSDAANRLFATFTTGATTPDTCRFVDQPGKPDVMTSASSGHYVKHTHTHRLSRHRLRCVSGFWVEAHSLAYRWYRDGHRITGANGAVHRLVRKDTGHRLTCKVLATNHVGTRVLGP